MGEGGIGPEVDGGRTMRWEEGTFRITFPTGIFLISLPAWAENIGEYDTDRPKPLGF